MPSSITRRGALAAAAALVATGCGYTLRPPFDDRVRTVHVPVFRSVSYRRDINEMLTLAVQDEIRKRTPFKIVEKAEGADSILEGVVNFADKNMIVENPYNLPRQLSATISVAVTWTDARAGRKMAEPVVVSEDVNFIPEVGEGSKAGFQKAVDRLARQIVGMMEQQKMDRKKWAPSTIMSAPDGADPFGSTGGGQGPSSAGPDELPNAF